MATAPLSSNSMLSFAGVVFEHIPAVLKSDVVKVKDICLIIVDIVRIVKFARPFLKVYRGETRTVHRQLACRWWRARSAR